MKELIKINKAEAAMLREKAPHLHIAITNRGKPYKGYYVEETRDTHKLLCAFRGDPIPVEWQKKPRQDKWNGNRSHQN